MATLNALEKAIADKVKEFKKTVKGIVAGGATVPADLASQGMIEKTARAAVMAEMLGLIEADSNDPKVEPSVGPASTAGAGRDPGTASAGGTSLKGVQESDTERYGIGTQWKALDGMESKKVQDMVHRFDFEAYGKDTQFEDWQRSVASRVKVDLMMLGFVYEEGSHESQIFENYVSMFSHSTSVEEVRDFIQAEFFDARNDSSFDQLS